MCVVQGVVFMSAIVSNEWMVCVGFPFENMLKHHVY